MYHSKKVHGHKYLMNIDKKNQVVDIKRLFFKDKNKLSRNYRTNIRKAWLYVTAFYCVMVLAVPALFIVDPFIPLFMIVSALFVAVTHRKLKNILKIVPLLFSGLNLRTNFYKASYHLMKSKWVHMLDFKEVYTAKIPGQFDYFSSLSKKQRKEFVKNALAMDQVHIEAEKARELSCDAKCDTLTRIVLQEKHKNLKSEYDAWCVDLANKVRAYSVEAFDARVLDVLAYNVHQVRN